ncbi:hypothetical protein TRIXIE_90 [Mycobacterium phage Trixie]|uniref:Gp84-like domain-containing protein n=1 Tax=Mycobacterium phage Trixie TaxID=1071503 RepID=G1JV48_9CAUD|nr:hypothetical protein TRIXIE_90 [Mycobacterium phage Trixie]AEL17870.1 hypothetical protein TRIXIE_90 [Mycobacterium phage Trixie]
MYILTCVNHANGDTARVMGSALQMVIDHLEATAERHGCEIKHLVSNGLGDIVKGDKVVGEWYVGYSPEVAA